MLPLLRIGISLAGCASKEMIMKSNSDNIPNRFTESNGKVQFAYNITEVELTGLDEEPRTAYNYDYVEVEKGYTRSTLIDALIESRYSKADEIAIINNFNIDKDVAEYTDYQAFRAECKAIVDEALS
jgi:hypothetical protein